MNDLFIGGGGYSGVIFIGALEYIHEKKLLDLKNFYGCSIGSLIGCLYISGYTPKSILSKFLDLNLEEIVKYDFNNLPSENYIIDDTLLDILIGFLWKYHAPDVTLSQFSNIHNVHVNIYTTNITKNLYTNFNNKDFPDVKLKDALRASMSIPFLFKPVNINDDMYIDGCCKNLYGSPPDEVYICGYSLILNSLSINKSYIVNVMTSMLTKVKPRSTFLIECDNILNPDTYLNLNKIDERDILDMYKRGINFAKESLKD
tara:strand:- start:3147 stop:3923 length:777 start_codon:yes stop_codon:yes gene_type:complete